MKRGELPNAHSSRTASPPGNGGRGLKQAIRAGSREVAGASPPGNGGRGLKLIAAILVPTSPTRIAPRQRGAWIETGWGRLNRRAVKGIAPRQRGAWIETACSRSSGGRPLASPPGNGGRGLKHDVVDQEDEAGVRIAPRQRGAWIETRLRVPVPTRQAPASPPGNGGRGLKQSTASRLISTRTHRPPATGGVD